MSLIVETGQAGIDSESYASVAQADVYADKRGLLLWATLTTPEKEVSLRRATDYMNTAYHTRWAGNIVGNVQALDFPRTSVPLPTGSGYYAGTEIPRVLVDACCALAFKAAAGELMPDIGQRVISESVGPISVTYANEGKQYTTYRLIDSMLEPLFGYGGFGRMLLERV